MSQDPNEPSFEDDDMFARDERGRDESGERRSSWSAQARGGVSDFVRRAIENTVGSVSSGGSVGRDALHFLLQQGDRGRKELLRIIASEVGDFLRTVDVSGEVAKVLTGLQIDFSANIKFRRAEEDGKVKPAPADVNVNIRRAKESEPPPGPEKKPEEET